MALKHSFKHLTLALAEHHKRTCDGESCTISLSLLKAMAEQAGVTFTEEEERIFW